MTAREETIQELDSFDSSAHSLSYHIIKGAPSIAIHVSANWSRTSPQYNKTTVVLEFNMDTNGFLRFLMIPIIKWYAEIGDKNGRGFKILPRKQ